MKKEIFWGEGSTTLFLERNYTTGFEVLDYEFDTKKIHTICGGRCTYTSQSGLSGAGFIRSFGELVPAGFYRVDTVYNEWQYPVEVLPRVELMLPYVAHEAEKGETLRKYPVVIRDRRDPRSDKLIYCQFVALKYVLEGMVSGKAPDVRVKKLQRMFHTATHGFVETVEVEFYNRFYDRGPNPWEFLTDLLEEYQVYPSGEEVHRVFRIARCTDGTLVRTKRIGGKLYATALLSNDPCEKLTCAPDAGWDMLAAGIAARYYDNSVKLFGWKPAKELYEKLATRMARQLPTSLEEDFRGHVLERVSRGKYLAHELRIPKVMFLLDKRRQLAIIHKEIAEQAKLEVESAAREFVSDYDNKIILEAIPDDLEIPLNEEVVVWDYPTKKVGETLRAGELKKKSGSRAVMALLERTAIREGLLEGVVFLSIARVEDKTVIWTA